jgi:hypothetical protein
VSLNRDQIVERLTRADWERTGTVEIDEWWSDGCWRIRSTKPPVPVELYLTFLVDPQWDRANTGEPPPIWAIRVTGQVPDNPAPTDSLVDVPFASRKVSARLDALVEHLESYRDERFALAGIREPWSTDGLDDSLAAELTRELAHDHPLRGVRARAIARRHDRDDVLFAIEGGPAPYAVVHLTGSGKAEGPAWPSFEAYESLAEWRRRRMRRDHEEWEAS